MPSCPLDCPHLLLSCGTVKRSALPPLLCTPCRVCSRCLLRRCCASPGPAPWPPPLQGILHRDIKPGNFLLASKERGARLKAIDFGLAVFFDEGKLPRTDLGLEGTPW